MYVWSRRTTQQFALVARSAVSAEQSPSHQSCRNHDDAQIRKTCFSIVTMCYQEVIGTDSRSDASDALKRTECGGRAGHRYARWSAKHGTARSSQFPRARLTITPMKQNTYTLQEIRHVYSAGSQVLWSTWHWEVVLVLGRRVSPITLQNRRLKGNNTNDEVCLKPLQSHNYNVGARRQFDQRGRAIGTRLCLTTMKCQEVAESSPRSWEMPEVRASLLSKSKANLLVIWQHWELRPRPES